MFKLGGQFAVLSDGCPIIVQDTHLPGPHVDHGFNREGHSRLQSRSAPPLAHVAYLRIFVKPAANAMANELPYDRATLAFGKLLNGSTDVA
jgi:hypothetical protein